MKTHSSLRWRTLSALCLSLLPISLLSQNPTTHVFEDWNSQAGTQNMFQRSVVRTEPGTTNYFLAGATVNAGGNYDLLVVKYNAAGSVIWSQQVNGNGNGDDYAADLQIDNSGNVFVTGTTFESSADSFNVLTVMYDSGGNQQWIASYNGSGSGNDGATSIYVDNASGDIYVAGAEWQGSSTLYDLLLIKYDSGGNQQWAATYDNTNLVDVAVRVRQNSGTGNIEVGGATQTTLTNRKYLVAEFDPSSGSVVNAYTSTSSTLGIENLTDLKTDNNGNVFVTGSVTGTSTGMDIRTLMLDTNLSIVWSATYSGALNDEGNALDLDAAGNILVTGYTTSSTQGRNFISIKYNSAGSQLWATTFNGGANGDDSATCIVVHPTDTNKIYVSGYSYNGSTKDYWTMKYDGAGNAKWEIGLNSLLNCEDRATGIALDTLGDVIITGQNKLNDSTYEYTTVKYVEISTLMPDDTISYTSNSFIYTENRGQVWGTDSTTHPEIKYYVSSSQPKIYFMDTAVSYVFAKLDTSTLSTPTDTVVRVDMKFKNANSNLRIHPMDKRDDYENFFLGHIPEGRSNVPNYNQLVSFNVWNNVDIIYGSNLAGMKYYFICKPGGGGNPVTQIDLFYDGADSVNVNGSGQLVIYTPLGNIVQPKAAAWQLDATGNYQSLGWQPTYTIVGTNEVKFSNFGSFNSSLPLIIAIDWGNITPTTNQDNLWWSTFYGGGYNDIFWDVVVSSSGKQIACGETNSNNFPVTLNAAQVSNGGAHVAIVVAFNQDNSRYWATYFGGSVSPSATAAYTNAHAIDVDKNGDVWFTGVTNNTDFPPQQWGGAYFQSAGLNNGCAACSTQNDAFVVKLSANGQTDIWSTWYGGDGSETGFDIKISTQTPYDWYFAGSNTSTNFPFPNTAPSWSAGTGFFVHSDAAGVPVFGSNIGATGSGVVYGIAIDQNKDVLLVGAVGSGSGFPIQQPSSGNTGNSTFGGGATDAFITKIEHNLSPNILWSTYWGGTGSEEARDVTTTFGSAPIEFYVTGVTTSSAPPRFDPGSGAYYQPTHGGGYNDAFILMADVNGNLPWATFYGGGGSDHGEGIALDDDRNIYVVGRTQSSNLNSGSIFPSPNLNGGYVSTSLNGSTDGYLACFRHGTFESVWGTYYGGSYANWNSSVDCDGNSAVYIVGMNAGSSTFPLYSGPGCTNAGTPYTDFVWSNPQGGGYSKASIAEFCLAPVVVGLDEEGASFSSLSVFPNPATNTISISGVINGQDEIEISIYDLLGQSVFEEKQPATPTINQQVDVSWLANGIYIVQVRSGVYRYTQKIIIQR